MILYIIISALLQGVSDPLIRKASFGIEKIEADNFLARKFLELKFLFANLNVTKNSRFLFEKYF